MFLLSEMVQPNFGTETSSNLVRVSHEEQVGLASGFGHTGMLITSRQNRLQLLKPESLSNGTKTSKYRSFQAPNAS